jgi:hypothetical protein
MRAKVELPNVKEVEYELRGEVYLAGVRAVQRATRQLEQDLEAQTRAVVKGNAWRAWKSTVYPSGARPAKDPVGMVFGNGGRRTQGMIEYWSMPGVNRSAAGFWRAIPTEAAGSRGRDRNLTPGQWERRTGIKLDMVVPPNARGRYALLVASGTMAKNKSGELRKFTSRREAQGRDKVTIPIFILIPEQPHANRVSIGSAVERANRRLIDEFTKGVAKLV